MPNLIAEIKDFVLGDAFLVTGTFGNIPDGSTVDEAWLTIKQVKDADASDPTPNAKVKKNITAAASADGQILDTGTGTAPNRTAMVSFKIATGETLDLEEDREYFFDVQIHLTPIDIITTPLLGILRGKAGVTNRVT